jgi:hypothetical protein
MGRQVVGVWVWVERGQSKGYKVPSSRVHSKWRANEGMHKWNARCQGGLGRFTL